MSGSWGGRGAGARREGYQCSISTCNRKKTALFFCSVPCWDAHVPVLRHRDAWAETARAPTVQAFMKELEAEQEQEAKESRVTDVLSRHVRALCDRAIAHAAADNRKTVMDRDFEAILKG